MFNDRSNKYRHEKQYCQQNPLIQNQCQSPSAPITKKQCSTKSAKIAKTPKTILIKRTRQTQKKPIEVKVKVKVRPTTTTPLSDPETQQEILDEINRLRARVQKMENEPRYNNWIIIGSDMFSEMIEKYGRSEALTFLTKSALTGDSVDVIKKLYLDGVSPEKYPIACRDYHHFRYLNDKREVIDDRGGQSVRKIFTDRAHKAMVLATNEMMQEEFDQYQPDPDTLDPTDEDIGEMFRKLGDVQCRLSSVHALDLERLAGMTNNPNHPFFREENESYLPLDPLGDTYKD